MNVLEIVYDNESYTTWFPQGLAYLASAMRDAGHSVKVYQQDIYHYPEEHLTEYLDTHDFDIVMIGVIGGYYQYRKLIKISSSFRGFRQT